MNRMLVVEDDLLSQMLMRRIFSNSFNVDICDSAEGFYENYVGNKYKIVIMDVSIKGSKHGIELIKEMKNMLGFSNTPILCLTAHAQNNMKRTALESGADLFITKPVNNKVLKEAVENLIKSA